MPSIITGWVAADGKILGGTGFSVQVIATPGRFLVTFDSNTFEDQTPAIIVTPVVESGGGEPGTLPCYAAIQDAHVLKEWLGRPGSPQIEIEWDESGLSSQFVVFVFDQGGGLAEAGFMFLATEMQ